MWAERPEGTRVSMGGELRAGPSVVRVRLPQPAEVRLLRNGVRIHEQRATALDVDVATPGVYRVEARISDRIWLMSNPIHLR